MNRANLASATLLLFCGLAARGQDQTFTATAPAVVEAGQQFQYIIEGSEQGELTLPPLEGFQLVAGPFSSYSSTSQWINGRMTMKTVVTYTHILRATGTGEYTIAPATVRVGRKDYRTNEVAITVTNAPGGQQGGGQAGQPGGGQGAQQGDRTAPGGGGATGPGTGSADGESEPVFLRVVPSKRDVYVGEQLVSGLKVYTRVNTRPASSARDIPYEGFYKRSLDPDATAQREEIGGQQYITQVIQRHILIPQKSGDVVIQPYESEWIIQQRVQRRGTGSIFDNFFDDPFFNSYQDVPVSLSTRPVTIRVKPLPAGEPEGFTGGVGDFKMNATLSASEVEVNEALSLKITVRGTGNLPLLGEPQVNLPPDHDLYDVTRSVNISTEGNRISGSVTFEYPIIARHAGRFRIAPVRFAWFDPAAGQYRSAGSGEFNFTVLKGETEESPGSVYIPGLMQERVDDIGTDIRDISRTIPLFTPLSATLFGKGWYKLLYVLAFLLAIAAIIIFRYVARRNADLKLVRTRKASRFARVRLKQADRMRKEGKQERFYEEIGKAIWGYLSDKLDIETSSLSRERVIGEMEHRGVEGETVNEFLRILDDSEFSRFAPSSEKSDMDRLYRDAAGLVRNLENRLS